MRTLYIIDGYAQFFRAYHAIRTPMTSPATREPTNMTFGFVGMLLKLLRGDSAAMRAAGGKPDLVCVALDVSGDRGTFRSRIYPEYKATRKEPPEDLRPQVDRCLAMLGSVGVPVLGSEGFEADDVIATLVRLVRESHPEVRVRIISKDKDLKQLLSDDPSCPVELFDIHTDAVFGVPELRETTGLRPDQVVGMLTLMGDTSDNVPGVEGVGEKTAAQLIAEHGSLEGVLAAAGAVKGKRGEKLREAIPRLGLTKELITLRDDVPVAFDAGTAEAGGFRLERMIPILRELGFNRYQDEVKALVGGAGMGAIAEVEAGAEGRGGHEPHPAAEERTTEERAAPERAPRSRARGADLFTGGLFDTAPSAVTHEPSHRDAYVCVRTEAELAEVVRALRSAPIAAVDTETTSLTPRRAKLCGISLSVREGQGWYIPVRSPEPGTHLSEERVLRAIGPWLEDASAKKAGHNLKYDIQVLRAAGVVLRGVAFDSMIASYLIDASRSSHALDALALGMLEYTTIPISDLIGSGPVQRLFSEVPLELATRYAAEDADVAVRLMEHMRPLLRAMGLTELFDTLEMPLVQVLAELEWNGICVDPAELDRQRVRLQTRIDGLMATLNENSRRELGRTFDPDSPKQLASVLFGAPGDEPPGLGIKPVKKTKTGFSTDAEVLETLGQDTTIRSPIPALILEYRQLTKLVGTYLVALREARLEETGRVHASFNQTVAATGRLSSSGPNLQNIPIRTDIGREIRRAFVAAPGRLLVSADYSQIELRLLAHLSRDPALIEAFHRGEDIHTAVAAQIHGVRAEDVTRSQRDGAKMVNFGIVYGITAFGLARRLGIGERDAAGIIAGYKTRFAGITTFLEECVDQARRFGYVETMMKRRRPIPEIGSSNPSRRALAERTAINTVVQGSAADLIKLAMVDLHDRLCPVSAERRGGRGPEIAGVSMLLQIHDELVFEAPEASAEAAMRLIVSRMESAMSLRVPLKAEASVGRDWFEGA